MGFRIKIAGTRVSIHDNDHNPPHIHAEYNEHEELIEIRTFANYAGWIPKAQHRAVLKYMNQNQQFLLDEWVRLTKRGTLAK